MKCGDCGHIIPPGRGYCVTAACHAKAQGENSPEKYKPLKAWKRTDLKRCPFCTGERNGKDTCFISACDRGKGGKSCGCHWQMAGMGNPGQEARLNGYVPRRVA